MAGCVEKNAEGETLFTLASSDNKREFILQFQWVWLCFLIDILYVARQVQVRQWDTGNGTIRPGYSLFAPCKVQG